MQTIVWVGLNKDQKQLKHFQKERGMKNSKFVLQNIQNINSSIIVLYICLFLSPRGTTLLNLNHSNPNLYALVWRR